MKKERLKILRLRIIREWKKKKFREWKRRKWKDGR